MTNYKANLCKTLLEKTYATKQKNVKSHVFWIWKKTFKNVKNVKVMTCKVLETTQSVFVL